MPDSGFPGCRGGDIVVNGQDVTELKRAEQRIQHMALHDYLTGLPQQAALPGPAGPGHFPGPPPQVQGGAALRGPGPASRTSTTPHGHQVGDTVLKEVGQAVAGVRARVRYRGPDRGGTSSWWSCRTSPGGDEADMVAGRISETLFQAHGPRAKPICSARAWASACFREDARDAPGTGAVRRPRHVRVQWPGCGKCARP